MLYEVITASAPEDAALMTHPEYGHDTEAYDGRLHFISTEASRITSYNVCYTKLLRVEGGRLVGREAERDTGLLLLGEELGSREPHTADAFKDVGVIAALGVGRVEFGVDTVKERKGPEGLIGGRITSYNVCYTKLLRC